MQGLRAPALLLASALTVSCGGGGSGGPPAASVQQDGSPTTNTQQGVKQYIQQDGPLPADVQEYIQQNGPSPTDVRQHVLQGGPPPTSVQHNVQNNVLQQNVVTPPGGLWSATLTVGSGGSRGFTHKGYCNLDSYPAQAVRSRYACSDIWGTPTQVYNGESYGSLSSDSFQYKGQQIRVLGLYIGRDKNTPHGNDVYVVLDQALDADVRLTVNGQTKGGWSYYFVGGTLGHYTHHYVIGHAHSDFQDGGSLTVGLAYPADPQIRLTAIAGNRQVTLSWSAPWQGETVTGYQYQRSKRPGLVFGPIDPEHGFPLAVPSGPWTDIPGTGLSHVVTDLDNEVYHYFRVRSMNGSTVVRTSHMSSALPLVPLERAPSLQVRATGPNGVFVTVGFLRALLEHGSVWVDMEVRAQGESDWRQVVWQPDTHALNHNRRRLEWRFEGLAPETTYEYRMRWQNGVSISPWSEVTSATTEAAPTHQTVVAVSNLGQANTSSGLSFSGGNEYAQAFTTGPAADGYALENIRLDFRTGSSGTGLISVELRGPYTSGNSPSSPTDTPLIATLNSPNQDGAGVKTFTVPSDTQLSPNTTYVLRLQHYTGTANTTPTLNRANSNAEDSGGLPGWSIANSRHQRGPAPASWVTPSDEIKIEVTATVPVSSLNSARSTRFSPDSLSVADARATEGQDATVDFTVSLSRAQKQAVTVDYATADGTATAGADYTATSGTLAFRAGETEKTVKVPILDDAVNEGEETFRLLLSNASGAAIADGTAIGTIVNADLLQTMWLSRFGRAVATQLTDAVSERIAGGSSSSHVTLGGQRVELSQLTGEDADPKALSEWLDTKTEGHTRALTGRELLLGSSFHLAGGEGSSLAAWGRVVTSDFEGKDDAGTGKMHIDGDTVTGMFGADAQWGDRLMVGAVISRSEADGTFTSPGVDSGEVESTLTAVSPYARLDVNEQVSVWGLLGYGTGEMDIIQAARETDAGEAVPERRTETDIEMRLGAGGVRAALLQATEAGGMDLALKADWFFVEMESDQAENTEATETDSSRVRLALESSRLFTLEGGGLLRPGLELGVRHDGGDAESGAGVEVGGRIAYADPSSGLSVNANARWLAAHKDSSYEEWGASASVQLDPGDGGRGLSFSLTPVWGAPGSGVEGLWSMHDAGALAYGHEFEARQHLEAQAGYGLLGPGGMGVLTPSIGASLAKGGANTWRMGAHWALRPEASLELEGTYLESAADEAPRHDVILRFMTHW